MSADPVGFPGHLQEGGPILVCNLFSCLGLPVTRDQLPSPAAEISLLSTSLWLCTEWDPLGVPMGTMYLVLLIRSKVARLEESLAPASSQAPFPDLGLFLFSSGDNAAQEQRGSEQVQS